jgi:hypothetical protein
MDGNENQLMNTMTRKSKQPMTVGDRDTVATIKRNTMKHQTGLLSDVE